MTFVRSPRAIASAVAASLALSACASLPTKQDKGALIGMATGAAVGGAIGSRNGGTAKGAIIGAAVGGVAGAVIGRQMDKQAKELEQQIPGAVVERVGEGIQVTFASGLLYDFNSDDVRADAAKNLRTFAQSLDKYPGTEVLIVGHTDDIGGDAFNQDLSDRRARAAASYLVTQGVERGRLRTLGRGEGEPVASNADEGGRSRNRRVEIAIFASEESRREVQKQLSSGI
jgi:outer membrane protein OmpA-like peptidoglycan-associated protein